jgi:hypothetical protein
MIYLYNTWPRVFFLPSRFIRNEIFHTNRYHNTYAYENRNWQYVRGGTGFDDDDDTKGMEPVMIKVVLLTKVTLTEATVDVFVVMIAWVKMILLLASA